jgi:hypothetical protein
MRKSGMVKAKALHLEIDTWIWESYALRENKKDGHLLKSKLNKVLQSACIEAYFIENWTFDLSTRQQRINVIDIHA